MRAHNAYTDAQARLKRLVHIHKDDLTPGDKADIATIFDDLRILIDAAEPKTHTLDDADIEQIAEDIREARG